MPPWRVNIVSIVRSYRCFSPKLVLDGFFAGQASLPEGKAEAGTRPWPSVHAADAGRDAITPDDKVHAGNATMS
jgi:hypothetical protein